MPRIAATLSLAAMTALGKSGFGIANAKSFCMGLLGTIVLSATRLVWWLGRQVTVLGFMLLRRLGWAAFSLVRVRRSTFGSARWATRWMLRRADVLGERGLILAKVNRKLLRDNNAEGSVLVLAPQGAGKGVGPVICNLLDYRGSILCTDPKGENAAITARHRATLGPVFRLDVGDPERSAAFNPMSTIRWGTFDEADDAEALADLMLVPDLKEESHWRKRALSWLTGFILYVGHAYRTNPELVTLAQVNEVVNADPETFQGMLEHMLRVPNAKVAETAAQILKGKDSEETRNILSNLVKGTEMWSLGKPLALISGRSEFSFEALYRQTATVFLIVPEEKLAIYSPFLRVMTGLALNGVLRAGRASPPVGERPLFLLDEAAALGYLEPLEKGMGFLRSYARAMLIFQDLGQLEATYPKARSLISNAATLVTIAVNDTETAEMLSKRIGATTVAARSEGLSQGTTQVVAGQAQAGLAEAGRLLIDASEILRLGVDEVLVFMGRKVAAPIRAQRAIYYQEERFAGLFDRWRATAAATDGVRAAAIADIRDLALRARRSSGDADVLPQPWPAVPIQLGLGAHGDRSSAA
jgi:type IV secretion system protein VirD4